ncbi:MAG: DUF4190 domain-containing protein [Clostridia bacterium]|nr:DUF4190 domain-containing protein [Clostridia bacterium]
MYCPQCGAQHDDGALFCPACGFKVGDAKANESKTEPEKEPVQEFMAGTVPPAAPAASGYSKKSVAGFVLSLVGMFCCGLICGILGIIFSRQGMRECDENPNLQGRGLAVAGLIISILDVIFMVIAIVFYIVYFALLGAILL